MAELTLVFLRVSIRTQHNIRKLDLEVMLELVGFLKCHGRKAELLTLSGIFVRSFRWFYSTRNGLKWKEVLVYSHVNC